MQDANGGVGVKMTGAGFRLGSINFINVITMFAGIILLIFATGPILGFASVFLIGNILSFLSCLFVTRWVLKRMLAFTDKPGFYSLKKGTVTENA